LRSLFPTLVLVAVGACSQASGTADSTEGHAGSGGVSGAEVSAPPSAGGNATAGGASAGGSLANAGNATLMAGSAGTAPDAGSVSTAGNGGSGGSAGASGGGAGSGGMPQTFPTDPPVPDRASKVPVSKPSGGYTVEANFAYGPEPSQRLDVIYPSGAGPKGTQRLPVVLMFHGGGWIHSYTNDYGSGKDHMSTFFNRYLAHGFLVCNAEYRVNDSPPVDGAPAPAAVPGRQMVLGLPGLLPR
jgi:hypothetical protein